LGITKLSKNGKIKITNNGNNILYARIISEGIPVTGDNTAAQNKLNLKVDYKSLSGAKIDVKKLDQGTNFIAEVCVTNPGMSGTYKQLALSQIFPSGWEIINSRMSEYAQTSTVTTSDFTYQDIRDDRVYTYFDLIANKSKTYKIMLTASYIGKFYLPTQYCEAMYDNTINARIPGNWVEVVASSD